MGKQLYSGQVKINSLKYDKKGEKIEEECEQIIDVDNFMATEETKWSILHRRASLLMHPLDSNKNYRHYHCIY